MSLRHALLALLDASPMTGYELTKIFDQSASRVWHATHPQITRSCESWSRSTWSRPGRSHGSQGQSD